MTGFRIARVPAARRVCGLRRARFGAILALASACSNGARSAGRCEVEHLDVTLPATIERGGATTRERLWATVTPTNVTPELFDSLAKTLVRGETAAPAVVWSVPAFNTNPGGVAVAHKAALRRGEVLRVSGVLEGGGWSLMPVVPLNGAQIGIEAGEFVARSAEGTVSVLETEPMTLALDLTARDSVGGTIRVRGDARFSFRRERGRCDAVAAGRG